MTQSSLKKQIGEYQPKKFKNRVFASLPKSTKQMGSLSVNNSVTNTFCLGIFDERYSGQYFIALYEV
jgi:hypothetical protein